MPETKTHTSNREPSMTETMTENGYASTKRTVPAATLALTNRALIAAPTVNWPEHLAVTGGVIT
jgi:hypothetical protein